MKKRIAVALVAGLVSAQGALAGDPAAGKAKSVVCASCHGANGISTIPLYPNLAGQKAQYTVKQLKAFRDGSRPDPVMKGMTAGLSDADIDNLSVYYESLK